MQVIKLSEAQKGLGQPASTQVVERSFVWINCIHRLRRDYERLSEDLENIYVVVLSFLMFARASDILQNA